MYGIMPNFWRMAKGCPKGLLTKKLFKGSAKLLGQLLDIVYCKRWTMRLGLCKWCYSPFWLVSCKFCDNMSPWNNTLAIMKIGTCNHEKWHIWSRKVIPCNHKKNSKLTHVTLRKHTMKFVTMKITTMKFIKT